MLGSGLNMIWYSHFLGTKDATTVLPLAEKWTSGVQPGAAFVAEFLGTFVLAVLVFVFTNEKNFKYRLPVPFILGAGLMCIVNTIAPVTNCGINPARDFGPRVIAMMSDWSVEDAFPEGAIVTVYWIAPLLGGLLGAGFADRCLPYLLPSHMKEQ